MFAQQVVDGVPVRGAYVYLASRSGVDGERLLASSYHLYQGPRLAMTPTVARAQAERDVRVTVGLSVTLGEVGLTASGSARIGAGVVAPGGTLVMSGLLSPQAEPVADEYVVDGFECVAVRPSDADPAWSSAVLRRR